MSSMTAYWQQFKECVDNLSASAQDREYSRQIATANNLFAIGVTIENLGLLEIQKVSEQLHEKAKLFQNEVSYTMDNHRHSFYLPQINSPQSLIFAIVYYQHLLNYQDVSYQGSINWFRQKVIDGINQKKITTAIQAQALLQEIRHYCQMYNLNGDEQLFLRKEGESANEYTSRLSTTFHLQPETPKEEIKVIASTKSAIATLEQSLELLQQEADQLKNKAFLFEQKLSAYQQAKTDYLHLCCEWKNKWFFSKIY